MKNIFNNKNQLKFVSFHNDQKTNFLNFTKNKYRFFHSYSHTQLFIGSIYFKYTRLFLENPALTQIAPSSRLFIIKQIKFYDIFSSRNKEKLTNPFRSFTTQTRYGEETIITTKSFFHKNNSLLLNINSHRRLKSLIFERSFHLTRSAANTHNNKFNNFTIKIMQHFFFLISSLQRLNIIIYTFYLNDFYLNVYSNINFLNVNIFIFYIYLAYKFYFMVSDGFGIFIISLLVSFLITDYIFKKINPKVDKGIDYNNKFMFILFIINSIMLITIILINIYASAELFSNIDEHIKIYNSLNYNNKSILLIISFMPTNYKAFYNQNMKNFNWILLDKHNKGINTSSIHNSNKNKNNTESLIEENILTKITPDNSISDLIPLKDNIESVNNLISPEVKDNNKDKPFKTTAVWAPLNLKNKQDEINESNIKSLPLSKNPTSILSRKKIRLTERDWKEMWSRKFTKYLRLGFYTPDFSDKLLFSYLNDKKQTIKSKYSFNNFLSGSQLITYNFNKNFKKVDLNSLYKYLKSFFRTLSSLISFPALEIYSDKIKIRLFYYVVPSKTKQNIHKSLHRYIRSDEKLYKELILRRKFKKIMEEFKIKNFLAKWKEDNSFIRIPNPISFFKGLSLALNEVSTRVLYTKKTGSAFLAENPSKAEVYLEQLNENLRCSNDEFNRPYEYNTQLDLLKLDLDLSKISQQHDQLKAGSARLFYLKLNDKSKDTLLMRSTNHSDLDSFHESLLSQNTTEKTLVSEIKYKQEIKPNSSIPLHNFTVSTNSLMLMKDVSCKTKNKTKDTEEFEVFPTQIKTSEAEELQSKSTGVISTSKQIPLPLFKPSDSHKETDGFQSPIKTTPESLTHLKDRKVSTIVSLNRDKFKYLIYTLEKLFKKTIILDLIRLKYPYHESNILAQVLSLSCKTKDFRQIMRKLLYTATISNPTKMVRKQNFTIIPSYLSGIKVRLGGRLITQRVVPRFTVQSLQIGSLARGKVNFTDSSRITLKNKRGAFSFTVKTSHIFDK